MVDPRQLTGWRQIAKYLGVSVRAAQSHEDDHMLPVHRMPGSKGRVWAVTQELDAWKAGTAAQSSVPATATSTSRRRWIRIAAGGGILGLGGMCAISARRYIKHQKRRPTRYEISGRELSVFDEAGKLLWNHTFDAEMEAGAYRGSASQRCVFTDLARDGQVGALFSYVPVKIERDAPRLIYFNPYGQVLWQFAASRTVIDRQFRQWSPPYFCRFGVVTPTEKPRYVIVSSIHYWSYPNQVAVLDAAGKILGEYWHRGHLLEITTTELEGHGEPVMLLGGLNDAPEYRQATLLVFDPRKVSGASVSPEGTPYFRGIAAGTEKAEIFFPRTQLSKNEEFNRVVCIVPTPTRITVTVAEGVSLAAPVVIYELDLHLNVVDVMLGDDTKTRYRELEARGVIPRNAHLTDEQRLRGEVKILRRI